MKVKTISTTYVRKISDGRFGSAEYGATVWADLEDEETSPEKAADALAQLGAIVQEDVRARFNVLFNKTPSVQTDVKPLPWNKPQPKDAQVLEEQTPDTNRPNDIPDVANLPPIDIETRKRLGMLPAELQANPETIDP